MNGTAIFFLADCVTQCSIPADLLVYISFANGTDPSGLKMIFFPLPTILSMENMAL